MIDFHSHVLPNIDDGSNSVGMSLEMLWQSYQQGVRIVVATPHCYLRETLGLENFLQKREAAYNILMKAIDADVRDFPEIRLGCELRVPEEIPDVEALRPLCIENTDYILTEMPYNDWNMNHYDFLYALLLKGMRPVMAHIERYMDKKKEFANLFSLDLLYQVNTLSFLSAPVKKFIPYLFERGAVQLIGSDMHNVASRNPNMKNGAEAIVSGYGKERLEYLMKNACDVLENRLIEQIRFPKMSVWERLKL